MSHQDNAIKLRRMAQAYKGIVEAADAFEALGSLETATAEATAARDAANLERDKAQGELGSLLERISKESQAHAEMMQSLLANAHTEAEGIVSDAKANANEKASAIIAQAQLQADAHLNEAQAQFSDAVKQVVDMKAEAEKLKEDNFQADIQLKVAQDEFKKLSKAIDGLKAKFA